MLNKQSRDIYSDLYTDNQYEIIYNIDDDYDYE